MIKEISRACMLARWPRAALVLGTALLVSGCLATAVTSISQSVTDAIAPKVNFLVPARNADSGVMKSVLVLSDTAQGSQTMAQEVESQMTKLRIKERPHYKLAKLGPTVNGILTDAQLATLAKSNRVEAIYTLLGGNANVKQTYSQEDRMTCAVSTGLFEACPQASQRHSKIGCTTLTSSAAVRLRVYRAADGRTVLSDTVEGTSSNYRCDDATTPRADNNQLGYAAMVNAAGNLMHIVAPRYDQRPLDIKDADAAVPTKQKPDFAAAVEFAKAKRTDEACSRFEELYQDTKESPALNFNVAFCNEMRGDYLQASQGYRRASELVNAPESQIDRRLAVVDKALRENPIASMVVTEPAADATRSLVNAQTANLAGTKRVALVIGNARYQHNALINPVSDAKLVGAQLSRIGFAVTVLENLDSARFDSATRDFAARAKGADVALFYYAGHALQVEGENYLMPVDNGKMRTMEDVRDGGGIQLASITALLDVAAPVLKLVVVDACRDNPLPSATRGLGGGGLAVAQPSQGGLIAFATAPGKTAEDGIGKNSVFSKNFAAQLAVPNQTIEQMFKRVREAVKKETAGRQEPTETSNLIGDVMLNKVAGK